MRPASAARLLRLYPAGWRARYGEEFAALLEEHPSSFKTLLDVLRSAVEAHMNPLDSNSRQPAALGAWVWCAWMLAMAAGMNLCGMVDDSPLVAAMNGSWLLAGSWSGIEIGSVLAGAAILLAGLPLAWSVLHYALQARRRDVLFRLAFPLAATLVFATWVAAVSLWTGGHWGASPWAEAFSRPDWAAVTFRWPTGVISAALLLLWFGGSAVSITQAMRRSEFPALRISLPGARVELQPLRFAAPLAKWAAGGIALMLISVTLWGLAASRQAAAAFHASRGPLGLSAPATWLLSLLLFGAAALFSVRAAWRARALRFDAE
jgi:hypothetical protein